MEGKGWWGIEIPTEDGRSRGRKGAQERRALPAAVLGLDPGSAGFCAVLATRSDAARLFPIRPRKIGALPVVDLSAVRATLRAPPACFVERVMGRGGWGATANFSFGAAAGGAVSLLASYGWPVELVEPTVWQKSVGAAAEEGAPKERALAAYRRLFPHDPLPRGRAGTLNENALDALLIAAHGVLSLGGELRVWRFGGTPTWTSRDRGR